MPKYLCEADYSQQGTSGLIKDGGSKRRAAVEAATKSVGGTLEAFYYAFGIRDVVIIVDLPDNVTAAALSLAVGATGAVTLKTTPLITCEEIDAAAKKAVRYRAPGAKK
ncbi:MAG: GYD domain-containing protein [Acidobacteria bacterium]|nr:GYD domain-containing protein [Acidobacteriota bacterium]